MTPEQTTLIVDAIQNLTAALMTGVLLIWGGLLGLIVVVGRNGR